jgi:hypothetical protein
VGSRCESDSPGAWTEAWPGIGPEAMEQVADERAFATAPTRSEEPAGCGCEHNSAVDSRAGVRESVSLDGRTVPGLPDGGRLILEAVGECRDVLVAASPVPARRATAMGFTRASMAFKAAWRIVPAAALAFYPSKRAKVSPSARTVCVLCTAIPMSALR